MHGIAGGGDASLSEQYLIVLDAQIGNRFA
jgi:hypothetical protein